MRLQLFGGRGASGGFGFGYSALPTSRLQEELEKLKSESKKAQTMARLDTGPVTSAGHNSLERRKRAAQKKVEEIDRRIDVIEKELKKKRRRADYNPF